MVFGLAFLVGMSRPLLNGVWALSVVSIVAAAVVIVAGSGFEMAACANCNQEGYTSLEIWRSIAAYTTLFAVIMISAVGVGVHIGREITHWRRRLISQP